MKRVLLSTTVLWDWVKRPRRLESVTLFGSVVLSSKIDEIVKTQNWDGKVKSFRCKARKSRVMRRTYRTSKSQRNEAQRSKWTFYKAIKS